MAKNQRIMYPAEWQSWFKREWEQMTKKVMRDLRKASSTGEKKREHWIYDF